MSQHKRQFSPEKYEVQLPVQETDEGLRLDTFTQNYLHSLSRETVKKKIELGEVTISGRKPPHKPSVKIHQGETITIVTYRFTLEEFWRGVPIPMTEEPKIIFENDELLVIYKPPYMATHPTGKHLFYTATTFYEHVYGHTMHSIHRLDRETSGVLLLGKKVPCTQKITAFFEKDLVQKCYFLIAKRENKNLTFPLTADEDLGQKDDYIPRTYMHCFPKGSGLGKDALTEFELLAQNEDYLVALAFPKTGRQHQIRTHAAHHGFPLLGDKLYNGDPTIFMRFKDGEETDEDYNTMQIPRHALHAFALSMPYPTNENPSLFISPLPTDLHQWITNHLDFDEVAIVNKAQDLVRSRLKFNPS